MEGRRKTFTTRQLQVVELIAAGCSNEEIGQRLGLSARTAKAHSDALRRKLGVAKKRQIPAAYRLVTGQDPLDQLPAALGAAPRTLTLVPGPGEVVAL
ncbi:MAG: helix-turn-helix transcriptional regulator [Actinobacteria bacterium]|nr:helix-turn-helix transcriptional regulator [Actinomycetota bacterium]